MEKINLKNYRTEVPAQRSIENIETLLIAAGATNIMKQYEGGTCVGISFMIAINNMKLPFQLPAKVSNVYKWLRKRKPQGKPDTLQKQAANIAWKIQHEWIHLQLSLIEVEQAEMMELLLPYLYDPTKNETYFQKLKAGGYKALLPDPSQ